MVSCEELSLSIPLSSGLVLSAVFRWMVWAVLIRIVYIYVKRNVPKLKSGKTYEAIAKDRLRYTDC